jgi:hypothetical protein
VSSLLVDGCLYKIKITSALCVPCPESVVTVTRVTVASRFLFSCFEPDKLSPRGSDFDLANLTSSKSGAKAVFRMG